MRKTTQKEISASKKDFGELAGVLAGISDGSSMESFLGELCTPTECLDLAKRWRLVKELSAGKTQRAVARELGMSLCRITRGARYVKAGDSVLARAARSCVGRSVLAAAVAVAFSGTVFGDGGEISSDTFSRPGVFAVRSASGGSGAPWRVEVDAWTTDIGPRAPVEFALITLGSGHGYEALFQTKARANDIKDAFLWAGLESGVPVSASDFRYWPRGERVLVSVRRTGTDGQEKIEPVSSFVSISQSAQALFSEKGFVFSGGGDVDIDAVDPGSIISFYNESRTLFDVPALAAQSDVYESILSSESVSTNADEPVKIVFEPEKRAASWPVKRVRTVSLEFSPGGFSIDGSGGALLSPSETAAALCDFRKTAGQDAFVSFSWDGAATLGSVRVAARLLLALEEKSADTGVRIDAPPEGFLYCKAFFPREEWRDRAKRYTQPCELVFKRSAETGAQAVELVRVDEKWEGESLVPIISTEEFSLGAPSELPAKLAANSPSGLGVLLVFAPSSTKWEELRPWLDAARPTHKTIQVFLD